MVLIYVTSVTPVNLTRDLDVDELCSNRVIVPNWRLPI